MNDELNGRRREVKASPFGNALAVVGLSLFLIVAFASTSLAVPPGSGGGGSRELIVKTSHNQRTAATSGLPIKGPLLVLAAGSGIAIVVVGVKRNRAASTRRVVRLR